MTDVLVTEPLRLADYHDFQLTGAFHLSCPQSELGVLSRVELGGYCRDDVMEPVSAECCKCKWLTCPPTGILGWRKCVTNGRYKHILTGGYDFCKYIMTFWLEFLYYDLLIWIFILWLTDLNVYYDLLSWIITTYWVEFILWLTEFLLWLTELNLYYDLLTWIFILWLTDLNFYIMTY